MKVPKPKSRIVKSNRLSNWDGVKDVEVGRATVDDRQQGNAHVTGKGAERDDTGFSDIEERRKRHGFLY